MTQRIEWIDTAKGIGIYLVVTGHLLANNPPDSRLAEHLIWAFHMPLFFFLSGLTHRPAAPGRVMEEISRTAKAIGMPYLFFSLLSIALWWTGTPADARGHGLDDAFATLLSGVSGREKGLFYNIPLWFFPCLFSVRMLAVLAGAMLGENRTRLLVAACGLAALAHLVLFPVLPRLPWNLDVAIVAGVFYAAGHRLAGTPALDSLLTHRFVAPVAGMSLLLGGCLLNGRVDMNYRDFGQPLLFYVAAAGGIATTLWLSKRLEALRWLRTVGVASVVIFPMHGLLQYFLPGNALATLTWYAFRATGSGVVGALLMGVLEVAMCLPFYGLLARHAPVCIGRFPRRAARVAS
ncbi:MAG TPA: acyltransferase family protein [Zoogloea sp.]|uniref:acyltransferase family protein n=1 Tax=Zoogloea sp. TaxID=49181 RepID=UPI002C74919D|nr:acyltransferase family protein [Zoogloea sp.]HMV18563.1 acyltransferase family protein [Rhodocyclaceae bacterium]HMV64719.1 acyltransferase family protein [Rhodocyclaceae bacterium]HMW53424.1 acyltransferase family protein [Rhodocyclaceae bacterium]HMY50718.1 acyltransferase family protein [Rhodocyclaceae bacterium]HMZ77677.1 acyltransferase family protein [Rhodocyclaceae bacterium]